MKPKVLAVAFHPGSANTISQVIKKLKEESRVDVSVIGHKYAEQIFTNKGISYKTIKDYKLNDISISSMEELLDRESPNLILSGISEQDLDNRDVIEQTTTFAAKNRGIPTLTVLEFWCDYKSVFSDINLETNQIIELFRFLPDQIAVLNQEVKDDMIKNGINPSILTVTGNPYSDDLESKARGFISEERTKLKREIGLSEEERVFFYAANAFHIFKNEENYWGFWDLDNIKIINDVLREDLPRKIKNKLNITLKLHPRVPEKDLNDITQYIESYSEGRIRIVPEHLKSVDPHKLILISDALLTPFSTLSIESLYMKKPCISLQPNLKRKDHLADLTRNGIIPVGYTVEDCRSLLKKAFVEEEYRTDLIKRATEYLNCDRKATERVVKLIYNMMS